MICSRRTTQQYISVISTNKQKKTENSAFHIRVTNIYDNFDKFKTISKVVFQELNIIYINNKWVVSEELNFKWITKQNLSASSNLFLFIFVGVDLLLWFYISFIYELMVSVIIIGMSVIYRSPIGFYFSPV
jgi:hypothetical protein